MVDMKQKYIIKCLFYRHRKDTNMKFNLFDFLEFEIDWKAVIGIGIAILGYALITM